MMEKSVYAELTDRMMLTGSVIIPRLLEMLADDREAKVLMAMPGMPDEVAAASGFDSDALDELLESLFHKGLIFYSSSGKARMCRDVAQLHDATILWPEATKEFLDLWQEFMETEWPGFARMIEAFLPQPFTRVVPVEASIDAKNQILSQECVREIVESADKLAVTNCTCRLIAGKCDHPLDVCLQVGRAAEYTLARGTGKEVTAVEAMEMLARCEDEGLIHVTMNTAKASHFICNCCPDCCQTMPVLLEEGIKLIAPSRYRASIDGEACIGCGACVERCPFDALTLAEGTNGDTGLSTINGEKCFGCGLCRVVCESEAIMLREARPPEHIPA